ncbi:MAG TPA: c-type cytochrome [Polyangia bacterium]|nr:c-type cytochrome [Polyangia bacterium]
MSSRFGSRTCSILALGALAGLLAACSSDTKAGPKPTGGGGAGGAAGAAAGAAGKAGAGGAGGTTTDGGATDGGLAALQARGNYLVNAVIACSDCHTPQAPTGGPDMTKFLAGNPTFIKLPNGDALGTRNLTNDETGLKNRTDDEIKNMFLNGMRPTATGMEALNPTMPYYVFHNMKAEDADAIVAYLRTVPAVSNTIPRRGASFDVPAAAPPLTLTNVPAPQAGTTDLASAMRGQYLATQIGLCVECHTKHLDPGMATVLDEAHIFEGGEDFSALFAATLMITPVSKNLTSDAQTGLGMWAVSDIVNVLKQGKAKDGTGICPPMPAGPMGAYGHLTDADATDIANYIHSLPPKTHAIVDMCVFPPVPHDAGADAHPTDAASHG